MDYHDSDPGRWEQSQPESSPLVTKRPLGTFDDAIARLGMLDKKPKPGLFLADTKGKDPALTPTDGSGQSGTVQGSQSTGLGTDAKDVLLEALQVQQAFSALLSKLFGGKTSLGLEGSHNGLACRHATILGVV